MEYTSTERLKRILTLVQEDPVCRMMEEQMKLDSVVHEMIAGYLPAEEGRELWAYPTALWLYHGRVLDLLCEQLRFPEEGEKDV